MVGTHIYMHASHKSWHNYPNGLLLVSPYKDLRCLAAVCYGELFTDDVIRTEGIRVELSQQGTKHLNTQSNGLVMLWEIVTDRTKQKQEIMGSRREIFSVNWSILLRTKSQGILAELRNRGHRALRLQSASMLCSVDSLSYNCNSDQLKR